MGCVQIAVLVYIESKDQYVRLAFVRAPRPPSCPEPHFALIVLYNWARDNGVDCSYIFANHIIVTWALAAGVGKRYATTELQKELKDDLGMSSGTFYTLWLDVKKIPGVTANPDERWIYTPPACNPMNN